MAPDESFGEVITIHKVRGLVSTQATARETQCTGVMTGTFNNDVVPPGGDCELVDSDVRGNVIALEHAVFGIANSTVGGDIKGKKADATVPFRPKGIVKPIHLWKKPELAQATL